MLFLKIIVSILSCLYKKNPAKVNALQPPKYSDFKKFILIYNVDIFLSML